MSENTIAINQAAILKNIAKSFDSQIEIICKQLMDADSSIMQNTEAVILKEEGIILLIKGGYGVPLYKIHISGTLHWDICCRSYSLKEILAPKAKGLRLLFAENGRNVPFGGKRDFSLGQIAGLFPEYTPFTFLQMLGFDSVSAEEEVNRYKEYLRDLILKSLSNSKTS